MAPLFSKFRFDPRDHDRLNPCLNLHGIKEMAAFQGFRIAYAMANLLHSREIGRAGDRLSALLARHQCPDPR